MRQSLLNFKKVDVSVIIVSFNTRELTLQCVESVVNTIKNINYEIIVVDNASDDGSIAVIHNFKNQNSKIKIKLIKNKENIGFARANNQGIKIAKGRFILLLNSDTIVKNGAIESLFEFSRTRKDIGVVVPKLLNKDGSVQASVFILPTIFRALKQYWFDKKNLLDKYSPKQGEPIEVESAVMAAFLITPQALEKVGMLNEKYFMYFEDLDYCRSTRKKGFKIYYLPYSEVVHYHGASSEKKGNGTDNWKKLIPSSKIYHGILGHYIFNFVLWSGQKWQKYLKKRK